ncbi:HXXEE domain-containing protein [Clostridium beijerinckii]|uniref:HXXEE domain-containing protein n=1 Tax=Clostridium beijerinckii TaxID=1520 RepID=UPI0005A36F77|nr:HXXEE domain-containing protein [Clostridium beijerinckii]
MSNMQAIICFFPMLFIIHDFEEIIFIQSWMSKNRYYLSEKFPKLSKKLLPHFDNATTASFAFRVAEEFITLL